MTYGYLRVSTDEQDAQNQTLGVVWSLNCLIKMILVERCFITESMLKNINLCEMNI